MAQEQVRQTRITLKHDTEANWELAENFRPKAGEPIIYDPDENHDYHRVKFGTGSSTTKVKDLPFIDKHIWEQIRTMSYLDAIELEEGVVELRVNALGLSEEVGF